MARKQLASLTLSHLVPGLETHHAGGDLFLESDPVEHVKVGTTRVPMHLVLKWQFPEDKSADSRKK